MSWFGWGSKKSEPKPKPKQSRAPPSEDVQEEAEKPRRRQPQARRAAPAARPIPDNIKYADQIKEIKQRTGFTNEQVLIEKLKVYGGDVNAVIMEVDLDRTQSSSATQSPPQPGKKQQTATETTEEKAVPANIEVQAVTATDVEFKAAAIFNVGDTVSSQLGFGRVTDVRDDGIIVVALGGQTKGYFSPDALTLSPDHLDFSTNDIVRAPMGRCKVLRVRRGDNMIVVITPTGSEGYFHPSALEKIDSKFFLRDQLPNIRSWTAATVREAVAEIYPEVAERLYAASVGGEKLIGMTEDEVLHLSKMGNSFNAELWDRVAATLGLTSMKDVDALSQGIAKTGPVGPLSEQLASGPAGALGRQEQGDPALIKLGQQQSAQIGRLEDMMVELDRLTLTPQLFELRQRQARMVKKLSGLLSALPNGIQQVRAAEIEARKAAFNAMDDEKVAGGGDAAAMAQLARRQDEVYARLVNAGNQLQEIAKKQGVKLPPFSPQPLPTFNSSMASMEKLIVEEKAQMATEEKSNFQLYQPNAVHGGKRGGDPLRAEVNGEAKSDDTFKVVFKVNKGEKREVDIPMSVGQKSVTVSGIKRAIEQFLGDARITEVRMGKKKTLQDTAELNIGRKRRIEGINVFTTDYEV